MPYADPAAQRRYQLEWDKRVARERRAAFFDGKVCVRCGSDDRLQLHHRDHDNKHASSMNVWLQKDEKRAAELARCEVLCLTCHQRHHKPRRAEAGGIENTGSHPGTR